MSDGKEEKKEKKELEKKKKIGRKRKKIKITIQTKDQKGWRSKKEPLTPPTASPKPKRQKKEKKEKTDLLSLYNLPSSVGMNLKPSPKQRKKKEEKKGKSLPPSDPNAPLTQAEYEEIFPPEAPRRQKYKYPRRKLKPAQVKKEDLRDPVELKAKAGTLKRQGRTKAVHGFFGMHGAPSEEEFWDNKTEFTHGVTPEMKLEVNTRALEPLFDWGANMLQKRENLSKRKGKKKKTKIGEYTIEKTWTPEDAYLAGPSFKRIQDISAGVKPNKWKPDMYEEEKWSNFGDAIEKYPYRGRVEHTNFLPDDDPDLKVRKDFYEKKNKMTDFKVRKLRYRKNVRDYGINNPTAAELREEPVKYKHKKKKPKKLHGKGTILDSPSP